MNKISIKHGITRTQIKTTSLQQRQDKDSDRQETTMNQVGKQKQQPGELVRIGVSKIQQGKELEDDTGREGRCGSKKKSKKEHKQHEQNDGTKNDKENNDLMSIIKNIINTL